MAQRNKILLVIVHLNVFLGLVAKKKIGGLRALFFKSSHVW